METSTQDYIPVPIGEFTTGVVIPTDLFVRLSDEKFVMVAKAHTSSNVDQFRNYHDKEVNFLWVRKKEFYKITHQSMAFAGMVMGKKDLDGKQKTFLVTNAARSMFRQLEYLGLDLETYGTAKQITDVVVCLVDNHRSLGNLFASLAACSDQILAHSVGVSILSVMIGTQMGFTKKQTLEKLGLGGLLHDVGLKALPTELLSKPVASMSVEEVQHYETHSYKGMQMLTSLGIVPDDIVSIVYEHHENSIGQGYPQRIRDVKIHPLAKVTALADGYCDLIIGNVNCPTPKNPREALMFIEHTMGVPYNREVFRALKRVVEGDSSTKTRIA